MSTIHVVIFIWERKYINILNRNSIALDVSGKDVGYVFFPLKSPLINRNQINV